MIWRRARVTLIGKLFYVSCWRWWFPVWTKGIRWFHNEYDGWVTRNCSTSDRQEAIRWASEYLRRGRINGDVYQRIWEKDCYSGD